MCVSIDGFPPCRILGDYFHTRSHPTSLLSEIKFLLNILSYWGEDKNGKKQKSLFSNVPHLVHHW